MKFIKIIASIIDDLLLLGGMGCIVAAVWTINAVGGLAALGAALIVYALIIARSGTKGGGT